MMRSLNPVILTFREIPVLLVQIYPYIFPSFPSVRPSVTASPATAVGVVRVPALPLGPLAAAGRVTDAVTDAWTARKYI